MMFCPVDGGQLFPASGDEPNPPRTSPEGFSPPNMAGMQTDPDNDRYSRSKLKKKSSFGTREILIGAGILIVIGLLVMILLSQKTGDTGASANSNSSTGDRKTGTAAGEAMKNSSDIEFVWVPAGDFLMGSPKTETGRNKDEGPQRQVNIREGFWMGKFEVTQGQWKAIMGNNPSGFPRCGPDCPVEDVSWNDAKDFIEKLNAKNDGFVYSLPTEAQWEYAARAGTTSATAFGGTLSSTQANFDGTTPLGNAQKGPKLEKTAKVGSYQPNAWGLFDMHGNVWEWVEDIYNKDGYEGLSTDGSANDKIGDMASGVVRGGSYYNLGLGVRSAVRAGPELTYRGKLIGFRLIARPKQQ